MGGTARAVTDAQYADRTIPRDAVANDVTIIGCQLAHGRPWHRPASMREAFQAVSGGDQMRRHCFGGLWIELLDIDPDCPQLGNRRW